MQRLRLVVVELLYAGPLPSSLFGGVKSLIRSQVGRFKSLVRVQRGEADAEVDGATGQRLAASAICCCRL